MSSDKIKKITQYGMLTALAFVFSFIEAQIPFEMLFVIPGIKIGLANIVVVTALYKMGSKEAFSISVIRIILSAFTFSNITTMLYSLAGGILSCLVMIGLKKTDKFSVLGVSIAGGVFHNVGQILMAMFMLKSPNLLGYLPYLMLAGIITGTVIGIAGALVIKRLRIK